MKKKTFLFLAVAAVLLAVACNKAGLEQTTPQTAEDYYARDLEQATPQTAEDHQARGLEYLNNGDYENAIAEFTQAITTAEFTESINLSPDFTAAYLECSLARWGRSKTYRELFWAHLDKGDWDSYRANRDQSMVDSYQFWADWHWYQYILEIRYDPNNVWAYLWRGGAYHYQKDYDRAIADFTQVISFDPNYVSAYHFRGDVYHEKKDYDRAIADYTQAILLDPNYASTYRLRGNAYTDKGDYDRAIADYEAALQLEPNNYFAKKGLENARRVKEEAQE